jgi:hypothetical protein
MNNDNHFYYQLFDKKISANLINLILFYSLFGLLIIFIYFHEFYLRIKINKSISNNKREEKGNY